MMNCIKILTGTFVGVLCVLGWAPYDVELVTIAAYAVLLLLVLKSSQKASLYIAFAFAIGLHSVGHIWVFESLINQTKSNLIVAVLGSSAFLTYLSLFTALPVIFFRYSVSLTCKPVAIVLMYAACMTLGEYARSCFFNGFTTLSLGYAFATTSAKHWLPLWGVYGLSLLAYCLSAMLTMVLNSLLKRKEAILKNSLLLCTGVFVLYGVGFCLSFVNWVQPEGKPLSYLLIQSSASQSNRFLSTPEQDRASLIEYVNIITKEPANVIITPETAFPYYLNQLPGDVLDRLKAFSAKTNSHLFLGIATRASNSNGYNSVVHISPSAMPAKYDKTRLMPFGEYSPYGFSWFTSQLQVSMKDLSAGAVAQRPFVINPNVRAGTVICHEEFVGSELRAWLPAAQFFINPSNLTWFDQTVAPSMLLQVVRTRALEMGRPFLRTVNTGVSAHINHLGGIEAALPVGQQGVVRGTIQPTTGITPYALLGDAPLLVLLSLILAIHICVTKVNMRHSGNRDREKIHGS